MGGRHKSFCYTHNHGYYVADGCSDCNWEKVEKARERREEIEWQWEQERQEALSKMFLKQVCVRCKKVRAWYNFQLYKNGQRCDVCFKCHENNQKALAYHQHLMVEKKLERLISGAMKNKMVDLRNHLFETLEKVKEKDAGMPLERARAICEIAQVIINSAKVEVEFLKTIGGKSSEFIQGIEIEEVPKLKAINE